MTKTVEEFADRYDEWATEYDRENDFEEYRAALSLVVEHADPGPNDIIVDLGTGTGAVALALAEDARLVVGRDISEGMLERAREKAAEQGVENVDFGKGRFGEPNVEEADVVVSNFAMHHLDDEGKRAAVEAIAELEPRKYVIGDVMLFSAREPEEPMYNTDAVYPSTVGYLANVLTDAGFAVTGVKKVHEQVGVVVAEICKNQ